MDHVQAGGKAAEMRNGNRIGVPVMTTFSQPDSCSANFPLHVRKPCGERTIRRRGEPEFTHLQNRAMVQSLFAALSRGTLQGERKTFKELVTSSTSRSTI